MPAKPSTVPAAQMVGSVGAPAWTRAGVSMKPLITMPNTANSRSVPSTGQVHRFGPAKARVLASVHSVSAPR